LLAYLFWHRPAAGVDRAEYEEAQRRFHAAIGVPSGCFRLAQLPFAAEGDGGGYEDWYLVDGWAALGELNEAAVDAGRRPSHDAAASLVGNGWAGVYRLLQGPPEPPEEARWLFKRPGEATADLLAAAAPVWQRQMVLGPAPEFCLGAGGEVTRLRVC
jgi:hypothetical protein